jgi:hypothetical protein
MHLTSMARTLTLVTLLLAAGTARAGQITAIDFSWIKTDLPPYTPYETYSSVIFTDAGLTNSFGQVVWKESDTQAPGIKVVNGDDKDGTNCVMVSGYNPLDGSIKMCSDDLKTSKRFKLHMDDPDQPIDLTFDVAPSTTKFYRLLEKFSNYTTLRSGGYTILLGFLDPNGVFTASKALDGLGFSTSKGVVYTKAVKSSDAKAVDLSAYFPEGLWGPVDKYHPEPGYFNPLLRAGFTMTATEDQIVSTGIYATYSSLFGDWLPVASVKWGMYWDADQDPFTDNVLVGNCNGTFDAATLTCLGTWENYRKCEEPDANLADLCDSDGTPAPVSATMLARWAADPWIEPAPIEDLANLNLTYYVSLGDVTKWPTYNGTSARFTIRITGHSVP